MFLGHCFNAECVILNVSTNEKQSFKYVTPLTSWEHSSVFQESANEKCVTDYNVYKYQIQNFSYCPSLPNEIRGCKNTKCQIR